MQYLFALLVLVALVICAMAQWPYYGGYYNTHALSYPYAHNYGAYGAYNYGAYPGYGYLWKK